MGAIAIITTIQIILLVIGLMGITISIIFLLVTRLILKKFKRIFIIIPCIVIILSLIPLIISIKGIKDLKNIINENQETLLNSGTNVYMKNYDTEDEDEYFIFNNKKYLYLTGFLDQRPNGIEIGKLVANIIYKEENILSKIFMLVYGIKERENILYTIKSYPDDSLLIMDDQHGIIFCEESKFSYYDHIANYEFYATYGHLPDINNCIKLDNSKIVNEIYASTGRLTSIPTEENNNYIFIFGISNDNIYIKDIASIIIINNEIYKEFGYFSEYKDRGMAILNDQQSKYIKDIIEKNSWETK